MSVYVDNNFRIKRNSLYQESMKKLIEAHVFIGYKDILMISAIIGYNNNKFVPIEKPASDGVLMQFFSQNDYDMMDLLAYAYKMDQSSLKNRDKYHIFSSYANGGYPILLDRLEIDENTVFDPETTRKCIKKYYSLLLSKGFEALSNEDVLI